MLSIRSDQFVALQASAYECFKDSLIPRFQENYPWHAGYLGRSGMKRVIDNACANAEKWGFDSKRDLSLYVDLSVMLGAGFDTDPQLSWVSTTIKEGYPADATAPTPAVMSVLWTQAMMYLTHILGKSRVFPQAQYQSDSSLWKRGDQRYVHDDTTLLGYLQRLWPEKASLVGDDALYTLIVRAKDLAQHLQLPSDSGRNRLAVYAFLFGHRVHQDPFYPWTAEALAINGVSPQLRLDQLIEGFERHLNPIERSNR